MHEEHRKQWYSEDVAPHCSQGEKYKRDSISPDCVFVGEGARLDVWTACGDEQWYHGLEW